MQIDIEVKGIDQAIRAMHKMSKSLSDKKSINAHVGNILQNSIEESFEREASPFGEPWKPSKKPSGKKTLTQSGTLSGSFTVNADGHGVAVGTNLVYAPIHQFGGVTGRKHATKIPARPFLPVDGMGSLEGGVKREILEYLAKKINI